MAKSPGYLDVGGRICRFDSAICRFGGGHLYVEAHGPSCSLDLVGVPFPGATDISGLPGRGWEPSCDDMATDADVFLEGGITIRGERFEPYRVRIACKSFNAETKVLKLEVEFEGETEESGYSATIEGWLACDVEDV